MLSVEELEQELYESEAKAEGLAETIAGSRVADLVEVVSKVGKMKGHITGLTTRQYEKFIGVKPPAHLLVVAKEATTSKVPWHLVLDQLASERGYKSDEELKEALEEAKDDIADLEEVKAASRTLLNEIVDKLKAEPEVETIRLEEPTPQFPDTEVMAEVTLVNGMRFRLRRQHSYWVLDTKDKKIKVRYAKDARKLARMATREFQSDIKEARTLQLKSKQKMRLLARKRRIKPKSTRTVSTPELRTTR